LAAPASLQRSNSAGIIYLDGIVLFYLLEVADIVHTQDWRVTRANELAEILEAATKKVIAGNNHNVIVDLRLTQNQIHVANCSQLVRIIRGKVVEYGNWRTNVTISEVVSPPLEGFGEPGVGNYVDMIDVRNRLQVIKHVFKHRLSRNREQRFWLIERERVKTRGITCTEND